MAKRCPKCSAANPADAFLCACGYEFSDEETGLSIPAALSPGPAPSSFPWATTIVTAVAAVIGIDWFGWVALAILPARPLDFLQVAVLYLCLAAVLFLALLYGGRVMLSPRLDVVAKFLVLCFIVIGASVLGTALVFAGCAMVLRF